jgi:hypothetical protein
MGDALNNRILEAMRAIQREPDRATVHVDQVNRAWVMPGQVIAVMGEPRVEWSQVYHTMQDLVGAGLLEYDEDDGFALAKPQPSEPQKEHEP